MPADRAARPASTAVVLAAGRGTRMRAPGADLDLDAAQRLAAAQGDKAMMPVGRPFLDYLLSSLADAGMCRVCLVCRPDASAIRSRYQVDAPPTRLEIAFAPQAEPLGTAHAILAAETAVGAEPFLVVNGDNLYPVAALAALAALDEPGLLGFEPDALVAESNIRADRIPRFALIGTTGDGYLARLIEKPDAAQIASLGPDALVSMNAWRFDSRIFAACRSVTPSARGELELQDAVARAMAAGNRFRVLRWAGGVLDLTSRADVAEMTERLEGIEVRL